MVNDLRIVGWVRGVRTIDAMLALRELAKMRLREAKNIVERVIDDETVRVSFPDVNGKSEFVRRAAALGLRVEE